MLEYNKIRTFSYLLKPDAESVENINSITVVLADFAGLSEPAVLPERTPAAIQGNLLLNLMRGSSLDYVQI